MSKEISKKDQAINVLKNVGEFLDAVAFTVVALFSLYAAYTHRTDSKWYYGLLGAGLIVSIQAFGLLVKHFSKKA
jgi:hypothetical protein